MHLIRLLVVLVMLAPLASSGIAYVNPVSGDDANSGTSPAEAVRTISRALDLAGQERFTIDLAPGIYDTAHGETFPLTLWGEQILRGSEDSNGRRPIINATGHDVAIEVRGQSSSVIPTRLRQLELIGGRTGVRSTASWFTISDCTIRGSTIGLDMAATTPGFDAPQLSRTAIRNCGTGIRYQGESGLWTLRNAVVEDCLIGIDMRFPGPENRLFAFNLSGTIRRCGTGLRMRSHSNHAEHARISMEVTMCGIGIDVESTGAIPLNVNIWQSTIAGCAEGVVVRTLLGPFSRVSSSILANNGSDAPLGLGGAPISFSLVPSGSLTGEEVLAEQPMFMDSASGDYRLGPGSPAIDSLSSSTFSADGNLDTSARGDMGMYEFHTLTAPAAFYEAGNQERVTVAQGELFDLDVFGEPGSSVWLFCGASPGLLRRTPFGSTVLTNGYMRRLGQYAIPANSRRLRITLEADVAIVAGHCVLQALVQSSKSPSGYAFTSEVSVEVLP